MPIKPKPGDTATLPPEKESPLQFRNNPEVQQRLDEYKAANPRDVEYYSRVVKEAPDRAVDKLLLKDLQRHESEMRLVEKQMPQAKEFYDQQPAHIKQRIDERLKSVQPYYHDKAFVGEVLREMNRKNRATLAAPKAGLAAAV